MVILLETFVWRMLTLSRNCVFFQIRTLILLGVGVVGMEFFLYLIQKKEDKSRYLDDIIY